MSFSSNHGQILVSLKQLIQSLQPEGLDDTQVEIRSSWLHNGDPFRGITIYDIGEQYDDGTIGTQDIGYVCGIAFVTFRDGDAIQSDDQDAAWRELVRRRLMDQRLSVTIDNASLPSEHVCIVSPGKTLTNPNKWPNYEIRQITVTVWLREIPTTP